VAFLGGVLATLGVEVVGGVVAELEEIGGGLGLDDVGRDRAEVIFREGEAPAEPRTWVNMGSAPPSSWPRRGQDGRAVGIAHIGRCGMLSRCGPAAFLPCALPAKAWHPAPEGFKPGRNLYSGGYVDARVLVHGYEVPPLALLLAPFCWASVHSPAR
jgi:hypothetical protein